ncbi:MAG: hypothetical protein NC132_00420 [Corallococcus sp.]|nr:hypothetical protein [Corallococcus sp.]MCM1359188.1 hypothetical protein [Corallococcus sp.]MCM1394578.1 hypothetical protein [Corallococcus sp.]
MKKVFVSLGIILVIAGIVIVGVYGGAKGFSGGENLSFHDLNKADEVKEFAASDLQDLEQVEVSTNQFCVYLVQSHDAEKVNVKYLSSLPDGIEINATYENKTLKITQTIENPSDLLQRIWSGDYLKYFVVVELPKTDAFENVKVTAYAVQGAVYIDGLDLHTTIYNTEKGE